MSTKIRTFQNIAVLKCFEQVQLKRSSGKTVLTESCPFCYSSHIHSYPTGGKLSHRVAHCLDQPIIRVGENGASVSNQDGYYLELQNTEGAK